MHRRKKEQQQQQQPLLESDREGDSDKPPLQPDPSLTPAGASMQPNALLRRQPVWLILAIASGACAACNGVFAKLYAFTPSICS
jgi:hypothetical protein